jgi:hypothetical protein
MTDHPKVKRIDSIITPSYVCLSLHPRNRLEESNAISFHKPACLLKGTPPLAVISITHLDHERAILCRQILRRGCDQVNESLTPTNVGRIVLEVSIGNICMLKTQFASIFIPERIVNEQFKKILAVDSHPLIATQVKS